VLVDTLVWLRVLCEVLVPDRCAHQAGTSLLLNTTGCLLTLDVNSSELIWNHVIEVTEVS